jgi:hypothetical protein
MDRSSTRHLVDPDLLPLIDNFPPMDISAETLPAFRVLITSPGRVYGFRTASEAAATTRAAEDSLRALRKAFAR